MKAAEIIPEKTKRILWFDLEGVKDPPVVTDSAVEYIVARSFKEATTQIKAETFNVITAVGGNHKQMVMDLLAKAKVVSPSSTRILLLTESDPTEVARALNQTATFRVLKMDISDSEFEAHLSAALDHHHRLISEKRLLQEVRKQNRQLQEMTENLERLVRERTQSVADSKREIEKKVARIRNLIRFTKDLAGMVAVEELLLLVRRELRKFHKLGDPLLAVTSIYQRPKILYFQGARVHEKNAAQLWSNSVRLRINEHTDSKYLADQFGRPFVKVISFPLVIRQSKEEGGEDTPPATLFFEHSLNSEEVDAFLSFISERLQPVSIALDRVLLEFEMKNVSYLWEHTFDGIDEPVAIVDTDYKLLRCNRHFSNDLIQRECHRGFQNKSEICQGCPVKASLASVTPQVGQVRRNCETYEVHSYPIVFSEDTHPTTVVNHYVDVTKAQDLQGRMIQNEKMAAIGHLAGNIAHELNNPLTGIRSLAQLLIKELEPSSNLYSDLVEVEKAASRSQSIINNLLEFSKGGAEERVRTVELNAIVERTLPLLKTAMGNFSCDIDLTEQSTRIRIESQLIQQVVFNLVNNACQAMSERGEIKIRTRVIEGPKKEVELRVEDSGEGIAQEVIHSIFDPFFTTKSEGKGTGLGLSMSRNIIRNFGGEITVESELGKGSCFYVRLPWSEDSK